MSKSIQINFSSKINFACYQNDISILKELKIINYTNESWENLKLKFYSSLDFIKPKEWLISNLNSGEEIIIKDRKLELNESLLRNLEESIFDNIKFTLEKENTILDELEIKIEVLAYNEWGGLEYIPELLAAFVMPNSQGIDAILGETGRLLAKNNKSSVLNGYEDNSCEKVWDMVSALYTILANKNFTYCLPPKSFEKNGQKIRLTKDILKNKVVTCLDASILFASAIEQMGLYPVIIILKEHAYTGVWLKPTSLGNTIIDDPESIRKRIDLKELLVFEAVGISSSPVLNFTQAKIIAENHTAYGKDQNFEYMLDIHQSRGEQIKPLTLNNKTIEESVINHEEENNINFEPAPTDLPDLSDEKIYGNINSTEQTRLNIWQKKLLNLSPSNPLLNCKINQSNIAILCPNPEKLEDYLSDGTKMSLVSAEKIFKTKIDPELRTLRTGENFWETQAKEALKSKQLLVNIPESKLNIQLTALYRKTKIILEEGGSNTLYLAIGFLNWKKKDKTNKIYHAPLILCPVQLERTSIQSNIKLSAHEDESRFNTTLLQMLQQDFEIFIPSLEGELPTDESGLDVIEIWNRVRQAVKEVEGFEVVEEVVLGHFSFNKYLMWKDLTDRAESMMKHPIIGALIDKTKKFPNDGEFINPKDLDSLYKPQDFFTPLPLDSSQLAVLAAADQGKSFVIEGPPGTGKSQTISNLIAHLIAKGKSVLFVSEKMAALNVVYKRLEQVGLGKYCLQLHSNKANKKDVLNQLRISWESSQRKSNDNIINKSNEILNIRNELNETVKVLHTPLRNGITPYYAMGICIKNKEFANLLNFNWESANKHSEQEFKELKELVHKIKIQAKTCENLFDSKFLNCIINKNWNPNWQNLIISESKILSDLSVNLENECKQLIKLLNLNINCSEIPIIQTLLELSQILKDSSLNIADYAFSKQGIEKIESLENAICHINEYLKAKEKLNCICPKDIWKHINVNEIKTRWILAENKWFLLSIIEKIKIKNELKKAGIKGNIKMPEDIENIGIMEEHESILQELDNILKDIKIWKIENSDTKILKQSANLAKNLRQISVKLTTNPDDLKNIRETLNTIITENREMLNQDGYISRRITTFENAYNLFEQSYNKLKTLCTSSDNTIQSNNKFEQITNINSYTDFANNLKLHEYKLKDWCLWQKLKEEAIEKNLSSLINLIELNQISNDDIETAFLSGYCSWLSKAIASENIILREFSSHQHADKIKQFIKLDNEFQETIIEYIQTKLAENIPSKDTKDLSSEWKIIQRETQKQRQIKPVRQILAQAGNAIKKLTPCLMMSPLSVAQYLPVTKENFDVIVFDEASQITVWDAIGTLSRGKQIIIAGDPKQMPPTNFFGRNIEYNEEELEIDEDLESILDELIASSMPTLSLNWHYRSRCESLIAFSNDKYYEGSLVTFPAAHTNQQSVSFRYVENGCYEKGTHINLNEAKEVVKECVTRLQNPNPDIRNKSIGIITFNSDQQKLIEDLLDKERELHPEIEFAFNPNNPNSVFIKNLETVQGDERDVILFTTTYGPDINGKISMNFGPLNKIGGSRRLNVAFTRSKYEMVIFSSLLAEQIDLNRTNSKGVADLKAFLQYAKQGKSALKTFSNTELNGIKSPFEDEVARILKEKGWNIHTKIGTSSYKIDIAVVHPDRSDVYLAGIECDGETYKSAATAKDRDKLRQEVLEGLDWNIIRIWSTDWWTNKTEAIDNLDKQLKILYENSKIETVKH